MVSTTKTDLLEERVSQLEETLRLILSESDLAMQGTDHDRLRFLPVAATLARRALKISDSEE